MFAVSRRKMKYCYLLPYIVIFALLFETVAWKLSNTGRRRLTINAGKSVTGDKIRVRLLKPVEGQGKQGDTTIVSKALWLNYLQPKKLAVQVTDEQIAKEEADKAAAIANEVSNANSIAHHINNMRRVIIKRKMGATGQLFGAVTHKQLLDMIRAEFPSGAISSKHFRIEDILQCNQSGNEADLKCDISINDSEIKKSGIFKIIVSIYPQISAAFYIDIVKDQ